jgi:hypothetical protein
MLHVPPLNPEPQLPRQVEFVDFLAIGSALGSSAAEHLGRPLHHLSLCPKLPNHLKLHGKVRAITLPETGAVIS